MIKYLIPILIILSLGFGEPVYIDGILVDPDGVKPEEGLDFIVIKSFPSHAPSYSMGLAFDGEYLWNDCGFVQWFGRIDTSDGSAVNTFNPTYGDRDVTFDGEYLWATDWGMQRVYKYDTSDCSVISSFVPPFAGNPDGMAWDGTYLWIGQEGGQIYQVDTTGTLIKQIPSPNSGSFNPRGLAFDGEYLWVGAQTVGLIYKIDTLGTVIASYSAPSGGYQQGLTYDGAYLWSTGGDNIIYQIDISPDVAEDESNLERQFYINCQPNPFHHYTKISFTVNRTSAVKIRIVDNNGRTVSTILDQDLAPGNYTKSWQRSNLKSGIYFMVMQTAYGSVFNKLVIID